MSTLTTGQKGEKVCISYLGPLALFAEKVSVSIRLPPILFKGVGPHQLPVTQVVNLTPLFLCCDTCQELFLGLHRNQDSWAFSFLLQKLHELRLNTLCYYQYSQM